MTTSQRAYSVRSAAAAYDVSETTLREAINKQELPTVRFGQSIRISADALEKWFLRRPPRIDDVNTSPSTPAEQWTNHELFDFIEEHLSLSDDADPNGLAVLELAIRLGVDGHAGLRVTNTWHPAAERLRKHVAMWEGSAPSAE